MRNLWHSYPAKHLNGKTRILDSLTADEQILVDIYDLRGRRVSTPVAGRVTHGEPIITLDAD